METNQLPSKEAQFISFLIEQHKNSNMIASAAYELVIKKFRELYGTPIIFQGPTYELKEEFKN